MQTPLLDLFEKMAKGIKLTPVEWIRLRREIAAIEEVTTLFKSLMIAGTISLRIDHLEIANNDLHMNEYGLFIKNQEGQIGFQDAAKTGYPMEIYSDGGDSLVFKNAVGLAGAGILIEIDSLTHAVMQLIVVEDADLAERLLMRLAGVAAGEKGSRFNLSDKAVLTGEGASGGYTALELTESADPTGIQTLTQDTEARIYVRANKLIIQWNDAGTNRYKYLDLTGTGVTWVHTTTAP